MPKYTVTLTYTYEVEANTRAEALYVAEDVGVLLDGECFVEESYFQEEGK